MRKEKDVVKEIIKWMKEQNHIIFKYHGGSFGVINHPDLYGLFTKTNEEKGYKKGQAFFIEVKRPGEKPRKGQLDFLLEMEEAGALVFWTDSLDFVIQTIE